MNISPRTVRFDDDNLWVELSDGRTLGVPLVWFPRLLAANDRQRAEFELTAHGIHWEALDEDISVNGLLAGDGDQNESIPIPSCSCLSRENLGRGW
jgi:hypothetical protein